MLFEIKENSEENQVNFKDKLKEDLAKSLINALLDSIIDGVESLNGKQENENTKKLEGDSSSLDFFSNIFESVKLFFKNIIKNLAAEISDHKNEYTNLILNEIDPKSIEKAKEIHNNIEQVCEGYLAVTADLDILGLSGIQMAEAH
jgi:hypothetical protein